MAGWAVGWARRAPFVFELGDLWPASIAQVGAMGENSFLRWMERLELYLYRRAACVVALTAAFKEDLSRRGVPGDKVVVIVNGVDLPRYGPRPRDREMAATWDLVDTFNVGYVGTHGMAHGLGNVLDAADRLRDRRDLRFVLVGAGRNGRPWCPRPANAASATWCSSRPSPRRPCPGCGACATSPWCT